MQKANDEQLIKSYNKHRSIWKVAIDFNMCGQSVQERLKKLNIPLDGGGKKWLEKDNERLLKEYSIYRDAGKLDMLAEDMGRTKQFICRKAKKLKLTNRNHIKKYLSVWKYMPEEVAHSLMCKFKKSSLTLGVFCKKHNYSEVGFWRTMTKFFPGEYEATIESKTPKQTPYRAGRAFEYRCRDRLKGLGYFVLRSPRSGSPVDLVAIRTGEVLFVQCKRSGGWYNVKEWNTFYVLCKSVGATPIYAHMPPGKTQGIVFNKILGIKDRSRKQAPCVEYNI